MRKGRVTIMFSTRTRTLNLDLDSEATDPFKEGLNFYFNDIHKTIQPEVDLELAEKELAEL